MLPDVFTPNSSPLQAMNLMVLFGLNPSLISNLTASKQVINPPPSSLAPVCGPTSQESMCPPSKIICSGYVDPTISPTTLLEFVLGKNWASIYKFTIIFCPLFCILSNIAASSTDIAAAGILGYLGS